MLAATPYRFPRRRRFFGLGAIKAQLPSANTPTLYYGGNIDQPVVGTVFNPQPNTDWQGGSPSPGAGTTWASQPAQKAYWFTSAVGPTAGGQGPGVSIPPGPQSPGGVAINTVTGGGNSLPPPVGVLPTNVLSPSGGASNTPVATEPSATIYPSPVETAKRWWPWLALGAVATAVGAYVISR
jgi:hypothetical protein